MKPKITLEIGYNHLGSKFLIDSIIQKIKTLNFFDITFQYRTTNINNFDPNGILQIEIEYLINLKNIIKENSNHNAKIGLAIDSFENYHLYDAQFDFIKILSFAKNKIDFFQKLNTTKKLYLSCGTEQFKTIFEYQKIVENKDQSLNYIYTSFDKYGFDISKEEIKKIHDLNNSVSFGLHQNQKEIIYPISSLFNLDRVFIYFNPGFENNSCLPDGTHSLNIEEIIHLDKMLDLIDNFKSKQPRNEFKQFEG